MTNFQTLYWIGAANRIKTKTPNREIEQKARLVMNEAPNREKARELSDADKKEIREKFFGLYFGLAWLAWMQGATLGAAWAAALGQVDGIVGARAKNGPDNPAAKYLRQVAEDHKKKWSEVIMTSENSGLEMNLPKDKFAEWKKIGEGWAREGLEGLNAKIKVFEPEMPQLQNNNILQMALWRQRQMAA